MVWLVKPSCPVRCNCPRPAVDGSPPVRTRRPVWLLVASAFRGNSQLSIKTLPVAMGPSFEACHLMVYLLLQSSLAWWPPGVNRVASQCIGLDVQDSASPFSAVAFIEVPAQVDKDANNFPFSLLFRCYSRYEQSFPLAGNNRYLTQDNRARIIMAWALAWTMP